MASPNKKTRYDFEHVNEIIEKELWSELSTLLQDGGLSDAEQCGAVEAASKHCAESIFLSLISPHCTSSQLHSALPHLASRGLWRAVGHVLQRGVSTALLTWSVHQAARQSAEQELLSFILPHCAEDQLDSVLAVLVKRGLWRAIGVLIQRVQGTTRSWAIEKACQEARELELVFCILPVCSAVETACSLVQVVARGLWLAVGDMLQRGVSDTLCIWTLQEAFTQAEFHLLRDHILPHYTRDHLNRCMSHLISTCHRHDVDNLLQCMNMSTWAKEKWRFVGALLRKGVGDSQHEWLVHAACLHAKKKYFVRHVLPHCSDRLLDSVLTVLVGRGAWRAVAEVLRRGVSDSKKRWAVLEACKHYKEDHEQILQTDIHDDGDDIDIDAADAAAAAAAADDDVIDTDIDDDDDNDDDVDNILKNYILPHYADAILQSVLPILAERNLFKSVKYVQERTVSDTERRSFVLTVFMCANQDLIKTVLPSYFYGDIRSELETLASRRFWRMFLMLLHRFMIDTFHSWAIVKDCSEPKERVFWDMVSNPCDGVKELSPAQWRWVTWSDPQHSLKDCLDWDTLLCEVLCEALLGTVREIWLSGREKEVDCQSHTAVEEARSVTEDIHQQLNQALMYCKSSDVSTLLPCIHRLCQQFAGKTQSTTREPPAGEAVQRLGGPADSGLCTRYRSRNPNAAMQEEDRYGENGSSSSPLFKFHFLKYLTREYYRRKAWTQLTDAVLVVLTTTPVVPGVQSVALRIMVREKRWDVIRHACLSCVCEQDRRQVFQAAVKQRQWGAVKRWADYSLYDDQRLWALGEAKEEKRWDVYLKLAGQGLNEGERMGVLHRVAMHADWKLVRHMVDTVADVSHIKDLLTNTRPTRMSRTKPVMCQRRIEQLTVFEEALKKNTDTLKTLKTAAKRGKWQVVLYNIRHKPDLQHARRALKAAVSSEAWQTVIQLVRLETDVTRRDSLFRDMVRQQQWAVCRELLDQGVSDDLCVEALNDLLEHRQWTLVALVMRCPMSEERRTEMMYRALMMREGSVVWQCINSLQRPLSSEQRENIFQLAFKREVWQAVKPLVEKKDETGIRHRDTALLEAIEQHQWDVVDYCQRHHADINMKDDDGHTPIHRAARKGDWEAVKELTVRDGDPNLLDSEGLSVLHRAIDAEQCPWDLVKLLIQFHGDIHLPSGNHQKITALKMLINARQIDVIQSTFMWCADQWKGVNKERETTLHAACLSGCPDILHDLIARRVNPLVVTSTGFSALCYAVLCKDCPQRMVAECIKLGFSVHQPHIFRVKDIDWSWSKYLPHKVIDQMFTCPLMAAVLRGLPVVTQMLYESGACSNRQLFMLTTHLVNLVRNLCNHTRYLRRAWTLTMSFSCLLDCVRDGYELGSTSDIIPIKNVLANLRQMSSTPRSLVSTCRLVISRCLTLRKTRHRDITLLPLSPMLKNYLMFTDLTDPDFDGHHIEDRLLSLRSWESDFVGQDTELYRLLLSGSLRSSEPRLSDFCVWID